MCFMFKALLSMCLTMTMMTTLPLRLAQSVKAKPKNHHQRNATNHKPLFCTINEDTLEANLIQSRANKSGKMGLATLSGIRVTDLGKSKVVYKVTSSI
ncbi:hypothetical protein R3P38DRAFT_3269442 [Favolaschia claudopus]|uniref:Uncharacterized protein n=1 Tax=Favolaschia claudopus TaxID=2862362 RepID=A0AAW0BIX1_9AGAR